MAKSLASMDKLRQGEKVTYDDSKAEVEKGITGVQAALKVLNEHYASQKANKSAGGGASGIINLLEVCEAYFFKFTLWLSQMRRQQLTKTRQ